VDQQKPHIHLQRRKPDLKFENGEIEHVSLILGYTDNTEHLTLNEILKMFDEKLEKFFKQEKSKDMNSGQMTTIRPSYLQVTFTISPLIIPNTSDSMTLLSTNLFSFYNSGLHFDRFSKSCGAGFTTSNSALKRIMVK
jgi:hypothetical protein